MPVTERFADSVWISFIMGAISFIFEIIIAIPLGIIAATKQYTKVDYTITIVALACFSLPRSSLIGFENLSIFFLEK